MGGHCVGADLVCMHGCWHHEMSGELTEGQILLSRGIEAINGMVERLSFDDAHHFIGILREHLDARFEQTRPLDEDFSDLLGG